MKDSGDRKDISPGKHFLSPSTDRRNQRDRDNMEYLPEILFL